MRRLALALVVAASATSASANPIDFLRGPILDGIGAPAANWSGYYAGVQVGTGSSDMNFAHATDDVVARLLANTAIESEFHVSDWPLMGKASKQSSGWGGFIGWNAQWDQAVLGVEINYMKGEFGGNQTGSMSRIFNTSNGWTNYVTSEASASIQIHDMGSARLRAGYAVGNWLPYAFGGVSFGLADIVRYARVYGIQDPNDGVTPPIPFDVSETQNQNGHFIFGYAVGLGLDIMLFGNGFLRAEWEYLKFTSPIDSSINTVRAGLGWRF
jgi:outer membrane immunogenic protein